MVKILSIALGLITFLGSVLPVSALTISPARIEVSTDPGQTINGEFVITNEQADDKIFYTSFENFSAEGESGVPTFAPSADGLSSWISAPDQIALKKGEEKKISFTIAVPQDAEAGGHFAAIFLSNVPPQAGQGEVSVGAKIGVLVLLRVSGEITEAGGIAEFSTLDKQKMYSVLPEGYFFRFRNDGSDRIKPEGTIEIKNMFGGTAANYSANKNEGNILPDSTRRFEVMSNSTEEKPTGFFAQAMNELENFSIGRYSANLALAYGNEKTADATYAFYVFPWRILLCFTLIIVVLAFFLPKALGSYNRYIIRQASVKNK